MTDFSASADAFSSLSLSDVEPGPDQRWSTWPAITPSERGPLPWPEWVVTSSGALDTELGILKTGKEADVFLIERAVPGDPTHRTLLAAKRYRSTHHRTFHRSAIYTEGRRVRDARNGRAMAKMTAYGREVAATEWSFAEFSGLSRMHQLGAPVPYPVQVDGAEVLMEFLGTGMAAAPRLAQIRSSRPEMRELFEQTAQIIRLFARAGFAHGDLSPYNLLVHEGRVRVIDLPQIVDIVANPNGWDLLHRDCVNVCEWFARHRVEHDPDVLFAEAAALIGRE